MATNPVISFIKQDKTTAKPHSTMDFLWSEDGEITPDDIAFLGVDCETTGLDQREEDLIQIGIVAFTKDYTPVSYFESAVFSKRALERYRSNELDPVVVDMHENNGLWSALGQIEYHGFEDEYVADRVEERALAWLEMLGLADKKLPLLGSSVTLDRSFLQEYMPALLDALHYRSVDASSVITVAANFAGVDEKTVKSLSDEYSDGPAAHTPVADVLTSAARTKAAVEFIASVGSDNE